MVFLTANCGTFSNPGAQLAAGGGGEDKDFSADLQMDLTVRGLVYLWHRL